MNQLDAISKAVAEGKTNSQFAVPDGKYVGDLFFITDQNNKIIVCLCWTGTTWIHESQAINVQQQIEGTPRVAIRMDSQ